MSNLIQKFKINFFNFSELADNEILERIKFKKYPTQFVFDAYSGLEIWGRKISSENEDNFVKLWNIKDKDVLKDKKMLKRYILDSIGIIIIIKNDRKEEFKKIWSETFLNYPVLIITEKNSDLDLTPNENIKTIEITDLNSLEEIEKEILTDIREIKHLKIIYKCADCNHDLPLFDDGNFRYCFCGKSGINHSATVTRLMGNTFELRKRI